jgi:hypothetical protein
VKCGVCENEQEKGHTLVLSEQERAYVKAQTGEDVESYFFCTPCWNLLKNRRAGASLIRGTMELNLRSVGHPKAQEMARRFYDYLVHLKPRE